MKQSINNVFSFSGNSLSGNIFISNLAAASNIKTLKKHNIKAVVTVAIGNKLTHSDQQLPDYLYIPAFDHPSFNLNQHFQQSSSFINKCLNYTNVLVHCVAGISRSATLVIAYLMKNLEKTSMQIIDIIRSKRQIISPNSGFRLQLKYYQLILKQQRMSIIMNKKIGSNVRSEITSPQQIKQQKPLIRQQRTSRIKTLSCQRRSSCPGVNKITSSQLLDIFNRRQLSNQKFKRKNLKEESNKKCFQNMVLNNQKKVQQRLSKIAAIRHL